MKRLGVASLALAGLLVALGTAWAFQRGAGDFNVFYGAWKLAWNGQGASVYHSTPDRFLYAPGFAWILAPLGALPRDLALALWCFAKAAAIAWMIRRLGACLEKEYQVPWGVAALGLVFLARPFLIDFQYGQVDLFLCFACVWALDVHLRESTGAPEELASWFFLALMAVSKLIVLPVLLVPLFVRTKVERAKRVREGIGAAVGGVLILALPFVATGGAGGAKLYQNWKAALIGRGFPLESHNQSFAALIQHYLVGVPTHVIALGPGALILAPARISANAALLLAYAWAAFMLAWILAWILNVMPRTRLRWIGILTAILILPSHLIWKPYFVMGIPAAVAAIGAVLSPRARRARWLGWVLLGLVFALVNFTGVDFVGYAWAGRLEAASILLFAHLVLIGFLLQKGAQLPQVSV